MGVKPHRAQELTPEQRTRAEHEGRRLRDAVDRLLASRVAQGFPAKVEDPAALARIAAMLMEHERAQRSQRPVDG